MSEEAKEAPKVENSPAEMTDKTEKGTIKDDTPGDRTACTILLILTFFLLLRAVALLIEHMILMRVDTDSEGMYMLSVTFDWLLACILNGIVIGKSLGRLKWTFYKVTLVFSLIFALANIVLFFGFILSY